MRELKKRFKIFTILLLGSIFISFLMLPNISNTPTFTSEQNSQTQDSTVRDNVPPKLSAPAPDVYSNNTFYITQSADDTWETDGRSYPLSNDLKIGGNGQLPHVAPGQRRISLRFDTESSIPRGVFITNVYLNLTVASKVIYNGFDTKIAAFDTPQPPDFSDDSENTRLRPLTATSTQSIPSSVSINETIQISGFGFQTVQQIVLDPYWDHAPGSTYIGLHLVPWTGTAIDELINFWSFDNASAVGKPTYVPTLYVEWEVSPLIFPTPADMTIRNGTLGYQIDWVGYDGNPKDYSITNNVTGLVGEGSWQRGVTISHDIDTTLDVGIYNYTLLVNDEDGNYELDSVIVNVSDEVILPVYLNDIKLIQNGKEVSYLQPGGGSFSIQFYNATNSPPDAVLLFGSYPEFKLALFTIVTAFGAVEVLATVTLDPDALLKKYSNELYYDDEQGCWILEPADPKHEYNFQSLLNNPLSAVTYNYYMNIQDIIYNLENEFYIKFGAGANDEAHFYKQKVYGGNGQALYVVAKNEDKTPPTFTEPEFIEPKEPDKHYEIYISIATEADITVRVHEGLSDWTYPMTPGAPVDGVYLYYKVDDGVWEEIKMVFQNLKYYGEIPPQEEGSEITYYIRIIDKAGNVVETDEYEEKATTFEVPSPIIPIIAILIGILSALSILVIYRRHKNKALKKASSEIIKKSNGDEKKPGKLWQKMKKVIKK